MNPVVKNRAKLPGLWVAEADFVKKLRHVAHGGHSRCFWVTRRRFSYPPQMNATCQKTS
jgi:hypothetical protein